MNNLLPEGKSFYTFDFFDTLFHRSAGHWLEFYRQLGREYQKKGIIPGGDAIIELFISDRVSSEQKARKEHSDLFGNPEITLDKVYKVFCLSFPFSADFAPAKLAELEFEIDRSLMVPNAALITEIKSLATGIGVISDTFYRSYQLKSILDSYDLDPEFIYASCEHNDGKHSGLFQNIANRLKEKGCLAGALHIGDNYHSDYIKPLEHGLNARHIPYGDSLFWEAECSAHQWMKDCFGEASLNSMPTARMVSATAQGPGILANNEMEYDKQSHYSYGYRCLGPLLTSFTIWLSELSGKLKPDALLFMMREGEVLHSYYEAVNGKADIGSSKFFISRKVAAQSAIFEGSEEELEALNFGSRNQTLEEYLRIAGISSKRNTSAVDSFLPDQMNRPCFDSMKALIQFIKSNPQILAEITENSRNIRQGLLSHIENLIHPLKLGDISSLLIVDVGWNGTIQKFLNQILEKSNNTSHIRLAGAYLMTTSAAPPNSIGFLASHGHPEIATTIFMRSPEIVEQCTSSVSYGTTVGYTLEGEPITRAVSTNPQLKEIAAIQKGALDFGNFAQPYFHILRKEADSQAVKTWQFAHLLRQTCMPFPEEIELFSTWQHDDNLIKDDNTSICTKSLENWLKKVPISLLSKIAMEECYWSYPLLSSRLTRPRDFINLIDSQHPFEEHMTSPEIKGSIVFGGLGFRHTQQLHAVSDVRGNIFIQAFASFTSKSPPYRVSLNLELPEKAEFKVTYIYLQCRNNSWPVTLSLEENEINQLIEKNSIFISNISGELSDTGKRLYRELTLKKGGIVIGPTFINWALETAALKEASTMDSLESRIVRQSTDDKNSCIYFKMILRPANQVLC